MLHTHCKRLEVSSTSGEIQLATSLSMALSTLSIKVLARTAPIPMLVKTRHMGDIHSNAFFFWQNLARLHQQKLPGKMQVVKI